MSELSAESVRHKIVEHMIGGGRSFARCLCGWGFGSNDQRRVDTEAERHIDGDGCGE